MANKNKKKTISTKRYFIRIFIVIGSVGLAILVTLLAIGIPFAITDNRGLLIALCIILPILILLLLGIAFLIVKNSYGIFFNNLFKNTINNIDALTNDKRSLNKYDVDNIDEFNLLNNKITRLAVHNSSLEISARKFDYSQIPLEYLNKKEHFVNEASFKKNIREIIYCSEYLRNSVVSIAYDNNVALENDSIHSIVSSIDKIFNSDGLLIALKEKGNGFFIYVPAVESLTALKDSLDALLQTLTISKKTLNGIELSTPTINAVIYPFSTIEEIFSDIRYSERQDDRINIYLPHRYINSMNDTLFSTSTNVNNTYKMIASLSNIKVSGNDFDAFLSKVNEPMRQTALFYCFDQAGIIIYDKDHKISNSKLTIKFDDNVDDLFPKDKIVADDFISIVDSSLDPDNSIFFSKRINASSKLGRQLDIYGISSGFIYKIIDVDGNYSGLIYFVNLNKKEIPLNSYLQSGLMTFSSILSGLIRNHIIQQDVVDIKEREQNLLRLTNIRSYSIDRNTFEVKSFSPSLKRDVPDLEVGQLCYKAMFGYDKPCTACPLFSKQKSLKRIRGNDYEVASVLNNKSSAVTELTLFGVNTNAQVTNRFDRDYLINTYYSFVERLTDLYTVKARGYVVLLKINNDDDLVDKLGSEGYAYLIRRFSKDINDRVLKNDEIYKYKNNTLAIILSSIGKLDAIEAIEKIYSLSKKRYVQDGQIYDFQISYDLTKYPQEHNNADDFVRHLESLCARPAGEENYDALFVEENNFTRPASKEEYILSIINQATAAKNFIIKCQPMMNGVSRSIFGSELLIRLSDEYYNSLLNTEEVIQVAAKYGKLYNISDILIDYVGGLYKQNGISIFKPAGFARMSINADYNYFKDNYSINKIIEAIAKHRLPKSFLAFEVTEAEIAQHYDAFKDIIATLRKEDIEIICDRYYGNNLSFNKLKEIGINEIKTDRSLIANIEINNEKFSSLSNLLESAGAVNMNITLLGIENGEQYNLIKGLNVKCNLQGYYFHHPLSANELIEAIRADNVR